MPASTSSRFRRLSSASALALCSAVMICSTMFRYSKVSPPRWGCFRACGVILPRPPGRFYGKMDKYALPALEISGFSVQDEPSFSALL